MVLPVTVRGGHTLAYRAMSTAGPIVVTVAETMHKRDQTLSPTSSRQHHRAQANGRQPHRPV
jgi:hypothetical protein